MFTTVSRRLFSTAKTNPTILKSISEVRGLRNDWIESFYKKNGRFPKIGFVPTMGALHEGHMSLMRQAHQNNDFVVSSVFVNPTQFGPNEDYDKYPRQLAQDVELLGKNGVNAVFAPEKKTMYPELPPYLSYVTIEGIDQISEGASRPGFYKGVATVVTKLFNIVQPTNAYFGQKDGLQTIVIRQFVRDLNIPVNIVVCPTQRAADGLALSSRNAYLSPKERAAAPTLYKTLQAVEQSFKSGNMNADSLRQVGKDYLKSEPLFTLDYLSVADWNNADELSNTIDSSICKSGVFVSIAAKIGTTRLIDNIVMRK
ncbi:hypothetical protein WA158_001367 [Blastocystis sp. Blastoise]